MSDRHPYASAAYAAALAARGDARPLETPAWSGFVMARPIAAGGEDAVGPYPRTVLPRDADLKAGLDGLAAQGMVSVVLVADPLTSPAPRQLQAAFGRCAPFKTHLVVDRRLGAYAPSKHHRYEIKRAQGRCEVRAARLGDCLTDWTRLYDGLIERHAIEGTAAFSDDYFSALAADPAYVALVATVEGAVAAMAIWFEHGGIAYNHLGASDARGYDAGASYALYDAAAAHFAGAWALDLGGGAGLADDADDGLARFKRGFANSTAVAWLCGAVLDQGRYDALSAGRATTYFPAYRG